METYEIEKLVVVKSYAVCNPRAIVVHLQYTLAAHRTMQCPFGLGLVTLFTPWTSPILRTCLRLLKGRPILVNGT